MYKETIFDDDKLHEECGVFGIYNNNDAAALTALGLHALQHRGQESAGIVAFDGENFNIHKGLGLVDKVFRKPEIMKQLNGSIAIGHNRYSTTGEPSIRNVQPIYADLAFGGFALAHNGNLTNANTLRSKLVERGALFQCTSDTEVIIHMMALSVHKDPVERLIDALRSIKGAYSLIACAESMMIGVRDPHGIRPLILGKLGKSYILASESCALDIIGAEYIRDIEPGELVVINEKGIISQKPFENKNGRFCIFEYIYFARPDSMMEGKSVYEMRKSIGAYLAKESPVENADIVVPVPDSGVPAAIGYSQESGIPFELGIIRNHYVGRTFIQPTDGIRHLGVKMKHNANKKYIEGKKVVLVDDSIVRGTTSRKIVDMVREAGAKEVHVRISSPPTKYSCFYGIDTPSSKELMAYKFDTDEICKQIGADSLAYISVNSLYKATGEKERNQDNPHYCDACFTGDYPVDLTDYNNNKIDEKITVLCEKEAS